MEGKPLVIRGMSDTTYSLEQIVEILLLRVDELGTSGGLSTRLDFARQILSRAVTSARFLLYILFAIDRYKCRRFVS